MLKIEIECRPDEVDSHLLALGLMRRPVTGAEDPPRIEAPRIATGPSPTAISTARALSEAGQTHLGSIDPTSAIALAPNPLADELTALERPNDLVAPEAPAGAVRKRGEPSPGKRRRTAAEVAEDLEHAQTDRPATPPAAISTGEARLNPEDDPVEFAQRQRDALTDAADEAAERTAGPLTLDDLRNAVKRYTDKHGVPAWVANGRDIVGCPIVEVPPEKIADAISRVDYATEAGPETKMLAPNPNPPAAESSTSLFGDDPKTASPAAPRFATKEEGQAAAQRALREYARKYDGHEDIQKAVNAGADVREIVKQHTKTGRAESAQEYEAVVGAIEAAIRDNPYGRQVHA